MNVARERDVFDVDVNFRARRDHELAAAQASLHQAKERLDAALRGTRYRSNRTLISTSYNLLREVEDLLTIVKKES